MSYQRPPTIHGLKTRDMVRIRDCDKTKNDLENISLIGNSIAALLRRNFQVHTEETQKQTSR